MRSIIILSVCCISTYQLGAEPLLFTHLRRAMHKPLMKGPHIIGYTGVSLSEIGRWRRLQAIVNRREGKFEIPNSFVFAANSHPKMISSLKAFRSAGNFRGYSESPMHVALWNSETDAYYDSFFQRFGMRQNDPQADSLMAVADHYKDLIETDLLERISGASAQVLERIGFPSETERIISEFHISTGLSRAQTLSIAKRSASRKGVLVGIREEAFSDPSIKLIPEKTLIYLKFGPQGFPAQFISGLVPQSEAETKILHRMFR